MRLEKPHEVDQVGGRAKYRVAVLAVAGCQVAKQLAQIGVVIHADRVTVGKWIVEEGCDRLFWC